MKAVQVMLDEGLLARLDATPEVQRAGRSAVLRQAVEEYLRRRQRFAVAEGYRAAYGVDPIATTGLGDEFAGWENEGTWPDE